MFLFHWRISKGSIIASHQLVLKEKYTLADLTTIMKKSTFKSTVENWDRSKSKLTAYTFRVS